MKNQLRGHFRGLTILVAILICAGSNVLASKLAPTMIVVNGETIVASAIATDAPWNADPTGKADSTTAIQSALRDVEAQGGGVVFLPAGRYRIDGVLSIGYCTSLRGAGGDPDRFAVATRTTLLATGLPADKPLLDVTAGEGSIAGVAVWYSRQSVDDPLAYPFTIIASAADLRDVALLNSYNGVWLQSANCCMVDHLVGTVLRRGLVAQHSSEFGWSRDIRFSNRYWRMAAADYGTGPFGADEVSTLSSFTHAYLVGADFGRLDGLVVDGFSADDAWLPIRIEKDAEQNQNNVFGFGAVVRDFHGSRADMRWSPWYYGFHFANVDSVPDAATLAHPTPVRIPAPSRTDPASFINVAASPYAAVGDGVADDTAPLQAALAAAGTLGGGTVYLPPGKYRVTKPLEVPPGVELRGSLGRGKARTYRNSCTILACFGADTANADSAPALITLDEHAGVRGLEIAHPGQGFSGAPHTYPYVIRGHGSGVWIADLIIVNAYYGIDLASFRCDRHVVRGVWATALRNGITIGGGSHGGVLEQICFSYGPALEAWVGASDSSASARRAFTDYFTKNSIAYTIGNCSAETTWGLDSFAPLQHYRFIADGRGECSDSTFWMSMLDVPSRNTLQMEAGHDIKFVGLWATGYAADTNWLEVARDFAGPLDIYGKAIQPTMFNHPITFGPNQVRFHDEVSLTMGRPASANASVPGHPASNAVDRDPRTYWQAASGNTLSVDLGAVFTIDRLEIESAGMVLDKSLNTVSADLYVSTDGSAFRRVATLSTDGRTIASRPVEPTAARFVRLVVTQPGKDATIRVNTFNVYSSYAK